jgi:DNA polymerase-4
MGSDYKKPDEVTVITPDNLHRLIWSLPVKDLIFVGKRTAQKLHGMGIETIGDLAVAPFTMLKDKFGVVGITLWMYANGIDDEKVRNINEPVKGIGNSSTLPNDAVTLEEINVMLLVHSEQVAKRLREIGKSCRTVQIHLKDSALGVQQHQTTLPYPTDLTEDIYYASSRLAGEIWNNQKIRQIGVRVTKLSDTSGFEQLTIFHDERKENKRQLNLCTDKLRERFGNNSIVRGTILAEGLQNSIWYEDVFMDRT